MRELGKLETVRVLALPVGLLDGLQPDLVARFRRRVAAETAWELYRHPERICLPLLAFHCVPREAAEKRVMEELLADATRVRGKADILFDIARAALANHDGAVATIVVGSPLRPRMLQAGYKDSFVLARSRSSPVTVSRWSAS